MINHEVATSVKIDPGNKTMDKNQENRLMRFTKMTMVFECITGVVKEKE